MRLDEERKKVSTLLERVEAALLDPATSPADLGPLVLSRKALQDELEALQPVGYCRSCQCSIDFPESHKQGAVGRFCESCVSKGEEAKLLRDAGLLR